MSAAIIFLFATPAGANPKRATLIEKILQLDLAGVALVMGAVSSYILALHYGGQTKPWGDPGVIGLLVGFILITIAFGLWEWYQGERAMMVARILKRRDILVASAVAFFFAGSWFIFVFYIPIYFQAIDGVSPIQSGGEHPWGTRRH